MWRRYASGGSAQQAVNLSSSGGGGGGKSDKRCTFQAIRDEEVGRQGKAEWITVRAPRGVPLFLGTGLCGGGG